MVQGKKLASLPAFPATTMSCQLPGRFWAIMPAEGIKHLTPFPAMC
jgi:hypothetical protein